MKTAAFIVETVMWLCHVAAVFLGMWIAGTGINTPTAVLLIIPIVWADYRATRRLRQLADYFTSRHHV